MVEEGVRRFNTSRRLRFRLRHWYQQVVLGRIDQQSDRDCVVAQLFGDFFDGLHSLKIKTTDEAALCGFALGKEFMTWPILNKAWKKKVSELLAPRR